MPNPVVSAPSTALGATPDAPPSYAEATLDGLLRPTPEHNPYGFSLPPSFQDPRYSDPPIAELYPGWRTPPCWADRLPAIEPQRSQQALDKAMEGRGQVTDKGAVIRLFNLATHLALSAECTASGVTAALDPRLLRILAQWCGNSPPRGDDLRARCRAMVLEFVRLLAAMVGKRAIGAEIAFDTLTRHRDSNTPPLLHALASLASSDTNAAMALCDFFSACNVRMHKRADFMARAIRDLLFNPEPAGLPPGDKYTSFYGRVFGDGRAEGRPGAPIVAYRLERQGFMPTAAQVMHAHSATRAAKWELCRRRGDEWGHGGSHGPASGWSIEACAARLFQRASVEYDWVDADPFHFDAQARVPDALPRRSLRNGLSDLWRSMRRDGASTSAFTRSPSPSPTAPAP